MEKRCQGQWAVGVQSAGAGGVWLCSAGAGQASEKVLNCQGAHQENEAASGGAGRSSRKGMARMQVQYKRTLKPSLGLGRMGLQESTQVELGFGHPRPVPSSVKATSVQDSMAGFEGPTWDVHLHTTVTSLAI